MADQSVKVTGTAFPLYQGGKHPAITLQNTGSRDVFVSDHSGTALNGHSLTPESRVTWEADRDCWLMCNPNEESTVSLQTNPGPYFDSGLGLPEELFSGYLSGISSKAFEVGKYKSVVVFVELLAGTAAQGSIYWEWTDANSNLLEYDAAWIQEDGGIPGGNKMFFQSDVRTPNGGLSYDLPAGAYVSVLGVYEAAAHPTVYRQTDAHTPKLVASAGGTFTNLVVTDDIPSRFCGFSVDTIDTANGYVWTPSVRGGRATLAIQAITGTAGQYLNWAVNDAISGLPIATGEAVPVTGGNSNLYYVSSEFVVPNRPINVSFFLRSGSGTAWGQVEFGLTYHS